MMVISWFPSEAMTQSSNDGGHTPASLAHVLLSNCVQRDKYSVNWLDVQVNLDVTEIPFSQLLPVSDLSAISAFKF